MLNIHPGALCPGFFIAVYQTAAAKDKNGILPCAAQTIHNILLKKLYELRAVKPLEEREK